MCANRHTHRTIAGKGPALRRGDKAMTDAKWAAIGRELDTDADGARNLVDRVLRALTSTQDCPCAGQAAALMTSLGLTR